MIARASLKFEVALVGLESLCQNWKYQVCPAAAWTLPVGWGRLVNSIGTTPPPSDRAPTRVLVLLVSRAREKSDEAGRYALGSLLLEAVDTSGLVVDSTWVGRWFIDSWVDVLPGKHTLRVRMGYGSVLRREFEVRAEPITLDLDLREEASAGAR